MAYMILSISHPWPRATGKYAAQGPNIMSPEAPMMLPEARRAELGYDIVTTLSAIVSNLMEYWNVGAILIHHKRRQNDNNSPQS